MTVFRNNRQQSSAARARRAVSVLQPLWKAALCWGGLGFGGFCGLCAASGKSHLCGALCAQHRAHLGQADGQGSGVRHQFLVPSLLTYLRLDGTAARVLPSHPELRGQRMAWGSKH